VSIVDIRAESRASVRARIREAALDTARETTVARGWSAVRMGVVAGEVGVSRQTLHAEFGTKQDLGLALVMREAGVFFDGVAARLDRHPGDLFGAVHEAVAFTVHTAADNPLLQTILTGATTAGGDDSLLPLLTIRSEPLLDRAVALFSDWIDAQWPDSDPEAVRVMVHSVARLLISHVLLRTDSADAAGRDLALVACRCLTPTDRGSTPA